MRIIRPNTITPAMIVSCNVPEDDYADWVITTPYVVTDTVLYEHKIYECLVNNTGYIPPDYIGGATPKWLDLGYDNRWKMLDQVVGSKTTQADSVTITIKPGLIDSIGFLDIAADTIDIVMTDPIDGIVYKETINLIDHSVVIDGYAYFFEPIVTDDAAILLGIPAYGSAEIAIEFTATGGTVEVGSIIFGLQKSLGITQYKPTIGINDYSKKEVDTFGNYTIVERTFSKRMSCDFLIENTSVDDIVRTLAAYRATFLLWVGVDTGFSSMLILGFFKSFSVTVEGLTHSVCNLEVEGLS